MILHITTQASFTDFPNMLGCGGGGVGGRWAKPKGGKCFNTATPSTARFQGEEQKFIYNTI